LAKATWLTVMVSPRLGVMPAAAPSADWSCATVAGGTDLSTSTATPSLLIAPGATLVCSTVLLTPKVVSLEVLL
jgi:hypothetical protein